ncbi:MAG TPA: hypothetical protein VIN60_03225 [Anaerolineales bacterium]
MKPFRYQTVLYIAAFLLALAVRLIRLGTWPLTDLEAQWALQALGVAQGAHPALGSQPAYILLTSIFFFFYGGGTNFLARFVPALVGSLIVFAPFLFRERLKPRPSLILAFFLAFDPGLVALSRQAGSSILAVTFVLFAWGFWERKQARFAGIFAALALLSGPSLWEGLLGLGLAWAIRQALEARQKTESAPSPARSEWLSALWFGIGTLLVVGTLFFLSPNGLSAWLASLPEYLSGWIHPSGISAGMMLFSLVAYQPLAVALALIATVRGWMLGSKRVMRLSIWALVALLLALFYPFHQVSDLAWMLIPLWALASLELMRAVNILPEERRQVIGVGALTAFILFFVWLQFLSITTLPFPSSLATSRIWLLFGSLALLVICILLVAVGWSARAAQFGAVWGVALALGVYSFGAMLGAGNLRVALGQEMWTADRTPAQADLLLKVANEMSDWSNNNINSQPVTIVGIDSPALEWLLRGHSVTTVNAVHASATPPPLVISTDQNNPALAAAYRGESFGWRQTTLWDNAAASDWMRWLAYHQMPQSTEKVIFWVRNDLFLDTKETKP